MSKAVKYFFAVIALYLVVVFAAGTAKVGGAATGFFTNFTKALQGR